MKGEYFMMKKHGLRRFFSLLLAVFMVCTLLPTAALAEDTTEADETQSQTVVVKEDEKKPEPPAQEQPKDKDPPAPEGPETFTVTYTDGADDAVFDDEVYSNLPSGTATPTFSGTLAREGHTFVGWNPEVAETVTGNATYVAKWEAVKSAGKVQKAPPRSNSTVVLRPSVNNTVTGVKVSVGNLIDGHPITSISGYDITVDLGKYNVNNDTFRLPYAKDIWYGVDDNKVDYISWAGGGSNRRSEGASALLVNGKNTAYYYFKGAPVLPTFTLNYDANGGTGAPANQTYKATSQYEKSYTFTISPQKPTRDGYTFLGWSTTRNATTADRQPGGSIVVTGTTTLYAVWKENTPPQATKPTKDWFIKQYGDVTVRCTNAAAKHADGSYPLEKDSISIGEPAYDSVKSIYSCVITVASAPYVEKFNEAKGVEHTIETTTVTRTVYSTDGTNWVAPSPNDSIEPIVFNVVCDTKPEPTTPGVGDLEGIENLVRIVCNRNAHDTKTYGVIADSCDFAEVVETNGVYTCNVTINAPKYVEKYNEDVTGVTHTLVGDTSKTLTLAWNADAQKWVPMTDYPVTFEVTCPPTAPDYDQLKKLIGKIKVNCTNDTASHTSKSEEYDLKEGSYTPGTINGDSENGYTYTITIKSKKYVDDFDTTTLVTHSPKTGEAPVTLEYKDKETGWTVKSGASVSFDVECEKEPYTPGNDEVKKLLGKNAVKIICSNEEANHGEKTFGLIDGTFSVVRSGYNCEVKINSFNEYVYAFNEELSVAQGTHASDASKADKSIINLKWENGEWKEVDAPAMHYVVCVTETTPDAPTPADLGNIVKVTCTTKTAHGTETYPLTAGDFSIGNVTGNAKDGYTCTITAKAAKYVASYIGTKGAHTYADPESKSVTLNWNATTKKWDVPEGTAITFEVKCKLYTVTYKDGADGSVFKTVSFPDLKEGEATPTIDDPIRVGYKFAGWEPTVAATVTEDVTYTARWEQVDTTFTVKYNDNVKGKAFKEQVYEDLEYNEDTPGFNGKPERSGYTFTGWKPVVADRVTKDVVYYAQWKSNSGKDGVPKTGDGQIVMILGSVLLFSFCGATAVYLNDRKRKQG